MTDKIFLDSNVLIYSIDDGEVVKQQIANNLITSLSEKGGVISTQVLQNFIILQQKNSELANKMQKFF